MQLENTKNKLLNLKNVVRGISTGYTFREKVSDNPQGDIWVVQMRDVHTEPPYIRRDEMVRINSNSIRYPSYLESSDLLVVSRGFRFQAVCVGEEFSGIIASSAFLVVRCDTKVLSPDYLAWYLNQSRYHRELLSLGATTTGGFVLRKQQLENFVIQLPPIHVQLKIANIAKLYEKERTLYRIIAEEREKLVNACIQSVIKPNSIKPNGLI